MATIEKMQPRPFKRKFLTPFAAPNTLCKQNTSVAASRRYSLNEFKKAWEIYPNDRGTDRKVDAPTHHSNEFPAGYSLAGCSPAEPASAFSAMLILNQKRTRWLELFSERLLSPNRAVSIHAAVHWPVTRNTPERHNLGVPSVRHLLYDSRGRRYPQLVWAAVFDGVSR